MNEIDIILIVLNHPLTWIVVISFPLIIVAKHYFKSKLEVFKAKTKVNKEKEIDLKSVTGKIEFAINNTDIAYQELTKNYNEAKKNMINSKSPNEKKIWENKMKSAEQQLKLVQKLMEHKDIVDMFSPMAIPTMRKIEGKIMKMVKGGLNI